ncbi:MAG: cyclopropane-fatty-acyl-phospholipid synthase family protein [Hylemonella sp.]|nr:cyclopropane-fatty-acyl-phospholipid synthase family protein [Hylemonella sp.]
MNTTTASRLVLPRSAPASARSVLRLLERLRHGTLTLQLPDSTQLRYGSGEAPHASLVLKDWAVFGHTLKSGDIGFAESYMDGQWTCSDLAALLRLFIRNRQELEDVIYGSWLGSLFYRLRHLFHRNTKTNSRKNIHAHYDLGNAFYRLWLDGTMNYSSAWFEGNLAGDMVAAQQAKVRRALRLAGVQPGDRVLEIGCGWGALAEMAVTEFEASLTGVTLSTEQLGWGQERMSKLGPEAVARADLRLQDYRDINDGPYDAICSIEMVEAVGQEYWPTYFQTVARLLKSGGRACVQSIVIEDRLFERYVSSTDFIQQYIFPGGCLPSPAEFRRHAEAAGLKVVDELSFGPDYAETLRRWRRQFLAERNRILQLGFDERFMHLWEFYLAYCEAAFDEANIDVVQYTLQKA